MTVSGDETPGATTGVLVSSPSADGGLVAFPFLYEPWTGTPIVSSGASRDSLAPDSGPTRCREVVTNVPSVVIRNTECRAIDRSLV